MPFIGDIKEFENLLSEEEYKICENAEVIKGDKLCVFGKDGKYKITYDKKTEFFRAFSILKHKISKGEENFCIEEKRKFDSCGIMLDVSRNAVMKTEAVKEYIKYMAKMGLNMLMLYTEDTFRMEKYPYFGYLRGAYTKDEIKEMVSFGEKYGVELVPCIQTLGHLEKTLKWDYSKEMRDTPGILLIDEEKTYEFIEEMIKTARECYHTDKIHIGMDEAHEVGLGEYLRRHGYCDRFELLSRHLKRVMEITDKYGFKPMMWSDMFFRLGSKDGAYYDIETKMPENIEEMIPKGISMVYWDYYNNDKKTVDGMIKKHKEMGAPIVFAGGIWTWSGLTPNYDKTFATTKGALDMCRKHGVKEVFATMWGDDGSECSKFEALLGLCLYGEYNYSDEITDERMAEMFNAATGCKMEDFLLFDVDNFGDLCAERNATISKQVFYSDVMMGLFDKNHGQLNLKKHYSEILEKLENVEAEGFFKLLFNCHKQYVKILCSKCDMSIRIKKAYDENDRAELKKITAELKILSEDVENMRETEYKIWHKTNKPFGFEYFDSKMGGVSARLKSAAMRIEEYLSGDLESLPELMEERLYFNGEKTPFVHRYFSRMISFV